MRPKRRAGMGYILILLIILLIFAAAAVFVSRRFAPSKEHADLQAYYHMTAYESGGRLAAESNELAIVINDKVLDNDDTAYFRAIRSGEDVFVGMPVIQDYIDSRFYLDKRENVIAFSDAAHTTNYYLDTNVYSVDGAEQPADYLVAIQIEDAVYLNMKFVAEHSPYRYQVFSGPDRLVVEKESGTFDYCTANTDIKLRTSGNKKSSIVAEVPKNAKLKVLDSAEGWLRVIDERGYLGYVQQNKFVSDITSETRTSSYQEPAYTHITLDKDIHMVWHGIYYYESNYYIEDYTYDMTGVNVLAPTWFLFGDLEGNLISYAETGYVDYAHEHGWQVWAVLEDMDGASCEEILPYTSKRRHVISQMLDVCSEYGIDGINVDLETVTPDMGNDFIQFLRELSIECRKAGLILSVDDYAPYSYNAYRHTYEQSKICDYVAIMAYDDYVGTGQTGPNASLPFVEEVMELCRDNMEDMSRLIVGIPFYTRVWYEYEDGSIGTEGLNMSDVENLTWEHGLTWNWQEQDGYDYAEYEENGATVKIWHENARSLEAKMELLSQYDIAGISAWRLGQETADVWEVLSKY